MKLEVAKAIVKAADEHCGSNVELYENYCFSYGQTTTGIYASRENYLIAAIATASRYADEKLFDELIHAIVNKRSDSLGKDTVYY